MSKTITIAIFLGSMTAAVGCRNSAPPSASDALPAPELQQLNVTRVKADLSQPDPDAPFWADVPRGSITLTAQPLVNPRPESTTTEKVVIQAVHDGKRAAFRVVWSDSEPSAAGKLAEFSDALALQFPANGSASTPVMMGGPGLPVHILHWRAQYQADQEKGKPEISGVYPNANVDMYAMDFKDAPSGSAAEKESFSPARVVGNPQSYPKQAVDEVVAEGFGTSAVQQNGHAQARAAWKAGRWTLVITRTLEVPGRSSLKSPGESQLAVAVWQGGKGEVGSRKSLTMSWLPLKLR
ncbi:MAG TPA: ethylbenzene dehydrogenase-related protein [Polyangiaceae bacterium]|nr:ethylbenzene dehydrogenase-related protein [Polyangiaceae bacterium]